jgi:hypothetical protein
MKSIQAQGLQRHQPSTCNEPHAGRLGALMPCVPVNRHNYNLPSVFLFVTGLQKIQYCRRFNCMMASDGNRV